MPPPPLGGLRATYTVHRLIRKLVVDFLFALIERVSAEALRANIDRKSAFLKEVDQFRPILTYNFAADGFHSH